MSSYVVAFRARPDRAAVPGEDQEWAGWFARLGPAITDPGNRVGATRTLPAPADSGSDRGDAAGRVLTGYLVITAADLDAAAVLAGGCPGLAHDVQVEVAEVVGS